MHLFWICATLVVRVVSLSRRVELEKIVVVKKLVDDGVCCGWCCQCAKCTSWMSTVVADDGLLVHRVLANLSCPNPGGMSGWRSSSSCTIFLGIVLFRTTSCALWMCDPDGVGSGVIDSLTANSHAIRVTAVSSKAIAQNSTCMLSLKNNTCH